MRTADSDYEVSDTDRAPTCHQLVHQAPHIVVRRPALLHGAPGLLPEHPGPLPYRRRLFAVAHYLPDGLRDHLAGDDAALLQLGRVVGGADSGPDLEKVHHELLVVELVGAPRPRDHRHAGAHGLQRGVPPAVRHEPAHGGVAQDQHLRSPPADDESAITQHLREPVRHPLRIICSGGADDPHEVLPGQVQAARELPQLGGGEMGQRAEGHVHDGPVGLRVKPFQARVRVGGQLAGAPDRHVLAGERDGAHEPGSAAQRDGVVVQVLRLQVAEAVEHLPEALRVGVVHALEECPVLRPLPRIHHLAPPQLHAVRQPRQRHHRVGVVGTGGPHGVVPEHAVAAGAREQAGPEERQTRDAVRRRGVHGPGEEAVGDDRVGAVRGQERVERVAEELDRVEELVAVVLRVERGTALYAWGEPHVGEGDHEEVDGWGGGAEEEPGVGAVHGRADHGGVHGGGQDGALDAARGEERGHVGRRDHVARRQEGEEEDVHGALLAIFRGHGCAAAPDRSSTINGRGKQSGANFQKQMRLFVASQLIGLCFCTC
ncbi:hypothetical protein QOZ80_1BG0076370 [Eleusine coracana subsp. coracana]|nr:hypothetical protein QOZ80_1BG0076370 [Eleusine coracana subsp. coracana]